MRGYIRRRVPKRRTFRDLDQRNGLRPYHASRPPPRPQPPRRPAYRAADRRGGGGDLCRLPALAALAGRARGARRAGAADRGGGHGLQHRTGRHPHARAAPSRHAGARRSRLRLADTDPARPGGEIAAAGRAADAARAAVHLHRGRGRHHVADPARRDHLSALSRGRTGRGAAGADAARLPQGHALRRRGAGLRVEQPAALPRPLRHARRDRFGQLFAGEKDRRGRPHLPLSARLAGQLATGRKRSRYADGAATSTLRASAGSRRAWPRADWSCGSGRPSRRR